MVVDEYEQFNNNNSNDDDDADVVLVSPSASAGEPDPEPETLRADDCKPSSDIFLSRYTRRRCGMDVDVGATIVPADSPGRACASFFGAHG